MTEIKLRKQAFPQISSPLLELGQNIVRGIASRSVVATIPQPRVRLSTDMTFRPQMIPVLPPPAPMWPGLVRTAQEKVLEDIRTALEKEWDIALAAAEGDEERVWKMVNVQSGYEPDALLKTVLKSAEFPKARRWPLLGLRDVLRSHRDRLAKKAERSKERRREVKRLDESIYKFGEVRLALSEHNDPLDEVHFATLDAEARLAPGEARTPGKVERRIKRNNRPSRTSVDSPRRRKEPDATAYNAALWHTTAPRDEKGILPDQIVRLDDPDLPELLKFFGDPNSLEPYIAAERKLLLEWLDMLARQRLAERELEVYELRRAGLENAHIAAELRIDEVTVRSTWHRIVHKLRPTA